jgi:hypothetical protein
MPVREIPIHPLAEEFPLIEGCAFDDLVASIKANGLFDPITLFEGAILDGRNRYRACQAADVEPHMQDFDGDNPLEFVISKNLHRRHLNESQRAMIAAKFATLKVGDVASQRRGVEISTPVSQAAKLLNVSRDSVFHAKTVLKHGTPEEIAAVKNGSASVSTIANDIRKNPRADKRPSPIEAKEARIREGQAAQVKAQRNNAVKWSLLRDALHNITSLPRPADVVKMARFYDKKTNGSAIERKLGPSLEWLTEFSDAWNNRSG